MTWLDTEFSALGKFIDPWSLLIFVFSFVVIFFVLYLVGYFKVPEKYRSSGVVIDGFSSKPLKDTPAGKLGASIMKGVCPDCGSKEGFYRGPQGGISVNIFCADPKCRSGFNFTNMFGEGHADRIGKGEDRLYD